MGTAAKKERRRNGEKFVRKEKVPTGVYVSKRDARKALREFEDRLADQVREAMAEEEATDDNR